VDNNNNNQKHIWVVTSDVIHKIQTGQKYSVTNGPTHKTYCIKLWRFTTTTFATVHTKL